MKALDLADLLHATRNDPDAFNDVFVNDGKSFWSRQREMCGLGREVPQDRRVFAAT